MPVGRVAQDDLGLAAQPVPAQMPTDAGREGRVAAGQAFDFLGLVMEILNGLQGMRVEPVLGGRLGDAHGLGQVLELTGAATAQAFKTILGQGSGATQKGSELVEGRRKGVGLKFHLGPPGSKNDGLGQGRMIEHVFQVVVGGDGLDHVRRKVPLGEQFCRQLGVIFWKIVLPGQKAWPCVDEVRPLEMGQNVFRESRREEKQGQVLDQGADVGGFPFFWRDVLGHELRAQGGPDDDAPVGVGIEAVLFQNGVQVVLQGQGKGDAQELVVAEDDGRALQIRDLASLAIVGRVDQGQDGRGQGRIKLEDGCDDGKIRFRTDRFLQKLGRGRGEGRLQAGTQGGCEVARGKAIRMLHGYFSRVRTKSIMAPSKVVSWPAGSTARALLASSR